jgi:hypothetical protein
MPETDPEDRDVALGESEDDLRGHVHGSRVRWR